MEVSVLKMDLKNILDRPGEAVVVTAFVDLTRTRIHGGTPFKTPVRLEAKAENRAGVVTLDCAYTFTLAMPCDRCLAPVEREMKLASRHTVVRKLECPDDESEGYLELPDGVVELDELAANDVLPEFPAKFLCSEDCKGLCPVCGHDLNEGGCGCASAHGDPRWDVLS